MARGDRKKARVTWAGIARKALTASASTQETPAGQKLLELHQPWQAQAFGYYNKMGECWNPVQFTARALSKVRLYAATKDENGEWTEIEDEGHWAVKLVSEWQRIPEPYGRLRTLIGEGRLCQSMSPTNPDEGIVWEFLSPVELRVDQRGDIYRTFGKETLKYVDISRSTDGRGGDPQPGQMRMWRFWRPHPENSGYADSAFRGVLDLYEQLWWLTLSERAELRNRVINAGLLLVPDEIDFEVEGAENLATEGEDPEVDPFTELLMTVITTALKNPGSAEAAAPPVIRADSELLHPDKFRLLRFHDPASSLYMTGREDALMRRISIGLDMPTEAFMGMGTLNHWNAWKLDDEKYQHVEPTIASLTYDLTYAVLRPVGRAMSAADADGVMVMADVAQLVGDPDKGKTALELYKEAAISGQALREANDFPEDAAMPDDEHEQWRLDHGRAARAADDGDPELNEEPPDDTAEGDGSEPDDQAAVVTTKTRFAEAAVLASRTAICTWLRSKRRTCPECIAAADNDPALDLLEALGPTNLHRLGITAETVTVRLRDAWFRAIESFGVAFPLERVHEVERYFAETLYDAQPFPPDLVNDLQA